MNLKSLTHIVQAGLGAKTATYCPKNWGDCPKNWGDCPKNWGDERFQVERNKFPSQKEKLQWQNGPRIQIQWTYTPWFNEKTNEWLQLIESGNLHHPLLPCQNHQNLSREPGVKPSKCIKKNIESRPTGGGGVHRETAGYVVFLLR